MDDTLRTCHPAVSFAYFALVIACAMLLMHPVCLVLSTLGGGWYVARLLGGKGLRRHLLWLLPMALLAAALNPAFVHQGVTILAYLPSGNPLTLESLLYGLAAGAMLSAVAAVLQFVEFSIPLIPSFVKLDISDLPALLGTFSLGPVYGVVIQLVKNLLHLPFGSSAGVGELSNFILGAVFVLCAGLVYRKHKSRKGALIGAMLGAVLMAVVSVPSNYFFVYPAYVKVYGMPLEAIIGAYQAILGTIAEVPSSNALLNCLLVFNVPFTFCKGLLDVGLCFLIYKPLSPLLHK